MDIVKPILLDDLKTLGAGLCRPECVVTHVSGLTFASDRTDGGGVSVIARDGTVTRILSDCGADPLRPNGIALLPGGRFLLAHLGAQAGGLCEMDAAWYREIARLIGNGDLGQVHQTSFRMRPGDGQGPGAYLDRHANFQTMPRFLVHETAHRHRQQSGEMLVQLLERLRLTRL